MAPPYPRVKVIAATGAEPGPAIRAALGETFSAFAARHGFKRSEVSGCINGRQRHARVREALAAELEVDRDWIDELLDEARAARRAAAKA